MRGRDGRGLWQEKVEEGSAVEEVEFEEAEDLIEGAVKRRRGKLRRRVEMWA